MQQVGEQVFYQLEELSRDVPNSEFLLLYFSLDEFNGVDKMLTTFITQLICHQPDHMARWSNIMFARLTEEYAGGWTHQDTLQWFDILLTQNRSRRIYLVLDNVDQWYITEFLNWITLYFDSRDISWKVFLTTRLPGRLSDWKTPAGAQFLPVDLQKTAFAKTAEYARGLDSTWSLLQSRFEGSSTDLQVLKRELDEITMNGDLILEIVMEQVIYRSKSAGDLTSLKGLFGVESESGSSNELPLLETILDKILRRVPLPGNFSIKTMLQWILFAARPLTVWELCTFLWLDSHPTAEHDISTITGDIIQGFKQVCEEWLSGVVAIYDNHVRLRHPRLQMLLIQSSTQQGKTGSFLWDDIRASQTDFDITKACLQLLSLQEVQRALNKFIITDQNITLSYSEDLSGLCSYIVQMWPQHFKKIPYNLQPWSLLHEYKDSAITITWARAHWALDNPITRPRVAWESVFPLMAALRLPIPHEAISSMDTNTMAAVIRGAASQGDDIARSLMAPLVSRFGDPEIVKTLGRDIGIRSY